MNNDKSIFWDRGIMLVTGCTKVSPGCKNCWSEKQHVIRSGQKNEKIRKLYNPDLLTDGKFNGKVQFNLYLLEKAAKVRKPHVYAIWNDFYHKKITHSQRQKALNLMVRSDHHTYLIVTKRIEVAVEFLKGAQYIPDHIWHIVTIENQAMADKRIPDALKIPGKLGLLLEPMLEFIDPRFFECLLPEDHYETHERVQQILLGGETGDEARIIHPEWVRFVRNQSTLAKVPFYFKKWGDYKGPLSWTVPAGRLLDGREYNELAWRKESPDA